MTSATFPSSEPAKQDKAVLPADLHLSAPVEVVEVLRTALRELLDTIHAGRFVVLDAASSGLCASVLVAGEEALVAQPPQAVQEVRMLTREEVRTLWTASVSLEGAWDAIQRKCAEVWGLKLAAISGATTKEN